MKENKLVPTLRFIGFDDNWKILYLKNVLQELIDCEHKTAPYIDYSEYLVVRTNNVRAGTLIYLDMKYTTKDGFEEWTRRGRPEYGDILFTREAPAGESCLVPKQKKVCLGQRMVLLRPDNKKTNGLYLSVYLNTYSGKRSISDLAIGTTVSRINIKDILRLKYPFPTLPEQQKIAAFLSVIVEKIQQLTRKKELLEQYKKGVMQQLFSGKLRFKDENGKDYPEWKVKSLGDILDYIQPSKYLVNSTEYDDSYAVPVLTAGKTFILGYTNEISNIFDENLPVILFDDFTTATQFVDFPFKAKSSAMKILVAKEDENISYIYEAMTLIRFEIGGHGRHWISQFSHLTIPYPCYEEQKKIASYLSNIDKKIEVVTIQITKTQTFKKGLLQQMFV